MYGYESWTIKKTEHQRIDAFELWCWRRLLRVPWTGRRSNQSILKGISPEYSLEGLMLKLKFQSFGPWCEGPTQWKRLWCWARLKEGGEGATDGWMASLTQWTWVWANSRRWWRTGKPGVLQSWCARVAESDTTERLNKSNNNKKRNWNPETWIQLKGKQIKFYKFSLTESKLHWE